MSGTPIQANQNQGQIGKDLTKNQPKIGDLTKEFDKFGKDTKDAFDKLGKDPVGTFN